MAKAARGLGRGFDALIPQDFDASILVREDERVQKIAIDAIVPRSDQPRRSFDEAALQELASSIETHGVLLPLVVTATGEGTYQIIAGERRWRAARMAKLATLPAIVRTLKELEQLEVALVENVQRVDLAPMEQAVSIERLHQQFALSYDEIAKRLGKAVSTVANIVRLLQLPEKAREALEGGIITEGHARAILALKDYPDKQAVLLENIEKHGWSVRQAERFVTSVKAGVKDEAAAKQRVSLETPVTKVLSERFRTPVFIRRTARGGRLEITFKTEQELERITKLLGKNQ
ncbi:MAG TPA: ParB/RepB/Spo0J family partition protein [Candidatus Saccharimonadales bacterium]|nr:ParB/RepB/Spo0J family partition protein [Candidatus Saccharimonadales bacterium]